jgi:uncharacterized repeat protein (TIGR01451 family)
VRAVLAALLVAASAFVVPPAALAQATPTLTAQASASGFPAGTPIFDFVTLSGGQNPTGTMTFELYGPDNPTCSGPPIFVDQVPVNGNGNYQSDSFTTNAAGTYQWIARYSGDANNNPVSTACGDPNQQVMVGKRTPTFSTQASLLGVGGSITDTATLGNGIGPAGPTGTIRFDLYGPNNLVCAPPPIFTSTKQVMGNGTYTSDPFTPTQAGTYQWIATYSGDANNFPAQTICSDPAETVVVVPGLITPTLTTTASPGGPPGTVLTDTATLGGGVLPTGTITFRLHGPDDATCSAPPVATSTLPVGGNGAYTSDPFTATAPGTYRWVASYSGDVAHNPVSTACGDPAETVTITPDGGGPATPTLTTQASAGGPVGTSVTDTATLTGGNNPTGTVTFTLFGPDNATCTGTPVFTSANRPLTNGTATSEPFTPTAPGTYRWVAAYSGDPNNNAVASPCNAPNETVTITAVGGGTISVAKSADPASLPPPGGTVTFTVTVTNTGSQPVTITGITDDVYGNLATRPGSTCGPLASQTVAPTQSVTCTFTASITGTAGQTFTDTVIVTATSGGVALTASDTATVAITSPAPQITVQKSVSPASRPAPGGDFTYTVTVTNASTTPLTLTALTDDVHGNLAGVGTCAVGGSIAPSGSFSCTFTRPFTGAAGASQTDTVTAQAQDAAGTTVTATASATVRITEAQTAISVAHTIDPASRPEDGGTFTHTVTVTNTGGDPVRITALTDDVYGDLATRPGSTCGSVVGQTVAPGQSLTCTFTASATGQGGTSQTDTVTATAVDDAGNTVSASGAVTVRLTDVPPRVDIDVTVSPASLPEPGGSVTYTVTVRNLSNPETVTITSLVSDVHGDLNGRGTCRTGVVLPPPPDPASVFTCSFVATVSGNAGTRQIARITVTVVDNEGTAASATSDPGEGAVTITDVAPRVSVDKSASPEGVAAPGGSVTFTVAVTNTGSEPVTLVSLVDDVYGDLHGRGTCARGGVLVQGQRYSCQFGATVNGTAGARLTDVVTATVTDDDGTRAEFRDTATVTILAGAPTPPLPPILTPPVLVPVTPTPTAVAFTGSDLSRPAAVAFVLVILGAGLVGIGDGRRRRRRGVAGVPGDEGGGPASPVAAARLALLGLGHGNGPGRARVGGGVGGMGLAGH